MFQKGNKEVEQRKRKVRRWSDWPSPEGIIQKLNGGVWHGSFSLSDQPVFVLRGEMKVIMISKVLFSVETDVTQQNLLTERFLPSYFGTSEIQQRLIKILPSRGRWSWDLGELWCCWSGSGTEVLPSRGSGGPAWTPSWRTAGSWFYTGGSLETCWPENEEESDQSLWSLIISACDPYIIVHGCLSVRLLVLQTI